MALDEYDEVIKEEFGTEIEEIEAVLGSKSTFPWYQHSGVHNGLEESNKLFQTLVTSPCFHGEEIIQLLNKRDLFEEKIDKFDFGSIVQELSSFPSCDEDQARELILAQFHAINHNGSNGDIVIHSHYICATDNESVCVAIARIKDIILKRHLRS